MKFEFTKINVAIISVLLVLLITLSYFTFTLVKVREFPPNLFVCQNQRVPFRANISNCLLFKVVPNNEILSDTLVNPKAKEVVLLFDPNSTARVGLAAHDIYKTYSALLPQTKIVPGIAYTYHWQDQPLIENTTIDTATFENPIVWLRTNQAENAIVVDGPRIYVNANTLDDLDAAACRIAIDVIRKVVAC